MGVTLAHQTRFKQVRERLRRELASPLAIRSVSSPQQATVDKDSLPFQFRDGRLWADSVPGDVVATFEIPGHSHKYIFFQDAEREIPA